MIYIDIDDEKQMRRSPNASIAMLLIRKSDREILNSEFEGHGFVTGVLNWISVKTLVFVHLRLLIVHILYIISHKA